MLLEAGLRNLYRRLSDVAAHIEQIGPVQWHVTVTAMQPGGWVLDETVPMVDLGVYSRIEDACDVADLILETWIWDTTRSAPASGRPDRSTVAIRSVTAQSSPAARRIGRRNG